MSIVKLTISLMMCATLLTACATTDFDPRACPREKTYSAAEQKQLAEATEKAATIVQRAMVDYGKLRQKARVCRGAK
jgi:hypothetical protein